MLQLFLQNLLGRRALGVHDPRLSEPPRLDEPVAIIGDVHGRDDLLCQMITKIAARDDAAQMRLILLGDMVDRGPDSAQVLRRVYHLHQSPAPFTHALSLMGNHERMALDFIDNPTRCAWRWWPAGGGETLASFGLAPTYSRGGGHDASAVTEALRDSLVERIGPHMLDWLRGLPLFWREGAVFVSHAGADPAAALSEPVDERALLWDRKAATRKPRADGIWLVQGHVIQPEPVIGGGRILLDTGAWKTGCLSAVILGSAAPEILQVRSDAED